MDNTNPSQNDIKKFIDAIAEYRKIDIQQASFDDIYEIFSDILKSFPIGRFCGNGQIELWRVRKLESNKNHDIIKKLSYPDKEVIKEMGRVNNVKESILYAAFDSVTAIREVGIMPGDRFSLIKYRWDITEETRSSTLVLNLFYLAINWIKKIGKEEKHYLSIVSNFIFTEFTRHVDTGTEYQYKATCAMVKRLWRTYDDSIIYPSMYNKLRFNLAMKPKGADKKITILVVVGGIATIL